MTDREPDLRRYVQDLLATLRTREPAAYRAFVARWRELHQRGAAEQLLASDDAALRLRMERMILDNPVLTELHGTARDYLAAHGAARAPAGAPGGGPTVRLRRRRPARAPHEEGHNR
ncbi:MAG TPA: hypothetical protein VNK05_10620 [Chloroflexota bacterium]|nr:hypothetical protein [Chloroflexota bacterium]